MTISIRVQVTQLGPYEWKAEVLSGLDPMVLRPAVRARKPNQAIAGLREAIELGGEKRPFVFAFEPDIETEARASKPKCSKRPERSRLLSWEKPERVMDIEAWKAISADGTPPGVYTPNMSPEDRQRWKAKLVGAKTPSQARVEIRKEWGGALVVIVVRLDDPDAFGEPLQNVAISQNGKIWSSFDEFAQLVEVVAEAREFLEKLRAATSGGKKP